MEDERFKMKGKLFLLMLGLVSLTLLLSACAPNKAAQPAAPAVSETPAASEAPSASETPAAKAEYRKLSAEEAKARMDSGDELIVLDVREESEFAAGHIPGALLLPLGQIEAKAAEALPDKNGEILVYCRSGNRSRQAANLLISLGYTNIYDFGGINSWPYDIVTEP